MKKIFRLICHLSLLPLFLTACGGSDGGDIASPGISSGTAVDPYIVNAVFKEIGGDGTVLQPQSSPSDEQGRFTFPQAVTPGSVIVMDTDNRGLHANAPFEGLLKRKVGDGESAPLVVSPLTTLLANGMSSAQLIGWLTDSGLFGLEPGDLFADPMAGLDGQPTSVSDDNLRVLQANMAVNAFLDVLGNYDYSGTASAAASPDVLLADMVESLTRVLNADFIEALAQIGDSENPVLLEDVILATVRLQRTMTARIKENIAGGEIMSPGFIEQLVSDAIVAAPDLVMEIIQERSGSNDPGNDPGASLNGEELFALHCRGCHGDLPSSLDDRSAVGIQAAINDNLGGMGALDLNFEEINAIAEALQNSQSGPSGPSGPSDPPTQPRTAQEIYDGACISCHKLTGHDPDGAIDLAGKGDAALTKVAGGHGGSLSDAELNDLADWFDTFAPAPPPVQPRTALEIYDGACISCHKLTGHDPDGAIDLAGKGDAALTKVAGGHGGSLSDAELNDLADWFDTFAATNPNPESCTSCHGQPPEGDSFPNTAGAHQVHAALPDIGTSCTPCHSGASHNDWVDLGFPGIWDAKSGLAQDNQDGTCSGISCHGGLETPDWTTGSIQVETQCKSCHTYGTSDFNGYWSGKHRKHVNDKGYACTVCHDTDKLAAGHFSNLATSSFELSPENTIKSSLGYNGSSCSTANCHGRESW